MKAPQRSRPAQWRVAAALAVLPLVFVYSWMPSGFRRPALPQPAGSKGLTAAAAPAPVQLNIEAELQRHTADLKHDLLQNQDGSMQQTDRKQQDGGQHPQARAQQPPTEQHPEARQPHPQDLQKRQQRCAIYNGVQFHSDVAAGIIWAFQEAGCAVTAYFHPLANGMQEVMAPWYRGQYRRLTDMLEDAAQYDVIVLVTFPEPPHALGTQRALLQAAHRPPPHQRLLLVTHNPDRLLAGCTAAREPWLLDVLAEQAVMWDAPPPAWKDAAGEVDVESQAEGGEAEHTAGEAGAEQQQSGAGQQQSGAEQRPPRIQLLALAPCVSDFTAAAVQSWAGKTRGGLPLVEVPWMAPLVPWVAPQSAPPAAADHSRGSRAADMEGGSGEYGGSLRHLCIQGSIDPKRRDYASAFQAASHPAVLAQLRRRNESLLLVGSGTGEGLDVPPLLRPYVHTVSDLAYEDYYALLSSCRAILTAFSSTEAYTTRKASSTLAVALQVGAPLLTEDSVLSAYSYYQRDAAYAYAAEGAGPALDPAALGAANGAKVALRTRTQQQAWHQQCSKEAVPLAKTAGVSGEKAEEREAGSARRLGEANAAARVGSEGLAVQVQVEAPRVDAGQLRQPTPQQQQQQQQQQEQRRQTLQEVSPQQEQQGGDRQAPPEGSYAAALLQAFDDTANRAAHSSAWQLKQRVMQHNADVAARFLLDTARLAAAMSAAGHDSQTGARAAPNE